MKYRLFICFFIIGMACQKESLPEDFILSELIIGKWERTQIMDLPNGNNEWKTLPYPGPIYEFAEDGTYVEIFNSVDLQPGTYTINDSNNTILLVVKGSYEEEASVTFSNKNEIIFGFTEIGGPVIYKYNA